MDAVQVLETRYLPLFIRFATELRERHPTFHINAGAGSFGSKPEQPGFHAYIDASRRMSCDQEPNCITLYIAVCGLPSTPTLCNLDVSWGADGIPPIDGLDLLPENIDFGPETTRLIDEAMPQLRAHLESCLRAWELAYPQSS